MIRGDTVLFNIQITKNSVAFPLSGCELWFTGKYAYSDGDIAAVFQKTIGDGITITSALAGQATMALSPADTDSLPDVKTLLLYDVQLKDANDLVYTVASGSLVVTPDVTRSV
jgi:hypothetical protein